MISLYIHITLTKAFVATAVALGFVLSGIYVPEASYGYEILNRRGI